MNKPKHVCIVGSGIGGGVLSYQLARLNASKITVIDTDSISKKSPVDNEAFRLLTEMDGSSFNQTITRAFGYGGTSNLWHGVLATLDPEDWRKIAHAAGWPIEEEVASFYGETACLFNGVEVNRLAGERPSVDSPLGEALSRYGFIHKAFALQKKPLKTRRLLLDAKALCKNIEFREESIALVLNDDDADQGRIASITVCSRTGEVSRIFADEFVICAGALESPRILLQSYAEKKIHMPSSIQYVGKGLIDHPWCVLGEIIGEKPVNFRFTSNESQRDGLRERAGYRIEHAENGNHCISIKPLLHDDYFRFRDAAKALVSMRLSLSAIRRLMEKFSYREVFEGATFLLADRLGVGIPVRRAAVFCYLEQLACDDSSVALGPDLDIFGRRVPVVTWKIGSKELVAVATLQSQITSAIDGQLGVSFLPYQVGLPDIASGAHHAGTLRIGRDPSNGVVDRDLRVFGKNNLYVCDLSIFPAFGNANPSFTLATFATRLAHKLVG